MLGRQTKSQRVLGQLTMVKKSYAAGVYGFERCQLRWSHSELLAQMSPQRDRHDAYRAERPPAQAQKPHVQCQAQFVRGTVTGVYHLTFGPTVGEKSLQFEGAEFARKLFQTQVSGLPALHRLYPSIETPTIRGNEVA